MKSLKTLLLTKTVAAAAIAAGGITAPAIGHASPDDGMTCRAGYSAQFGGATMKCAKVVPAAVSLLCSNVRFPTKVIRAPGAPGDTSGGKDLCTRPGIVIGTTDALTGLVLGQDFVFAEVNPSLVASKAKAIEIAEQRTLNLQDGEVDAKSSSATVTVNGGFGSDDQANFTVTLFTFPIPALGFNLAQPTLPTVPLFPRLP
jgi:hypothetical protein